MILLTEYAISWKEYPVFALESKRLSSKEVADGYVVLCQNENGKYMILSDKL